MDEFDLYHVLDVNPSASFEEIKCSYHSLIKQWHPDKVGYNSKQNADASQIYDRIDKAWQILSNDESRRKYNKQIKEMKARQEYPINEDVDIDDMEDDGVGNYAYDCRCGGMYNISENDLEAGIDIAPCTICSLTIRILYTIQDSHDDNDHL